MDLHIRLAREWDRDEHLRHLDEGDWLPMFDAEKRALHGIHGKRGVSAETNDGTRIGADYIRMQPGSSFPLHVHEGEHEIYFIRGSGFVRINGSDEAVREGHIVHIPAEYPHGVWVPTAAPEPLVFVAVGHPHKHVDAADRMRHPDHSS
jgi:quercetin dioxygenase-like cupin family protein